MKSVFDPCPAGWILPAGDAVAARNPWAGFSDGNFSGVASANGVANAGRVGLKPNGELVFEELVGTVTGNRGYRYTGYAGGGIYANPAWYPSTGRRLDASGVLNETGITGRYWSASYAKYFAQAGATYILIGGSAVQASGFPLRCISEN